MANHIGNSNRKRGCLIVIGVLVAIPIIGAIFGGHSTQSTQQGANAIDQAEKDRDSKNYSAIFAAKQVIRAMLKDPSSGVFSQEFAWMKNGHETACGEVNAKNSFGAMTGDQSWIVIPDQNVAMIESYDNGAAFRRAWNSGCVGNEDRSGPAPTEFAGVKLAAVVPATLQSLPDSADVLTPKAPAPVNYLGVRLDKVWFTKDGQKIDTGAGTAKGGFTKLSDAMLHAYGVPNADTGGSNRLFTWLWPTAKVQLQDDADRDTATVTVFHQKNGKTTG